MRRCGRIRHHRKKNRNGNQTETKVVRHPARRSLVPRDCDHGSDLAFEESVGGTDRCGCARAGTNESLHAPPGRVVERERLALEVCRAGRSPMLVEPRAGRRRVGAWEPADDKDPRAHA
jgi:hypothetical protein